ncbi:uncharacterized protein LOC108851018 isoform X1 [Raphanus sativus]|uniref:Uncharacterized protein LOC108851018 isoform X1 n=1 Tax=Raphanus sativus TaxID=3726 RepID=A0A9W3DHI1_RAPSA|nr:uncharacterized protein LOC108851018 isoform X1 [Raphanus sativus]
MNPGLGSARRKENGPSLQFCMMLLLWLVLVLVASELFDLVTIFDRLCTSQVCSADIYFLLCIFKCFTLWDLYAHPPYRIISYLLNSERRGEMKSCTDKQESILLAWLSSLSSHILENQ